MKESFTKDQIRTRHQIKIREILDMDLKADDAVEVLVNYVMSRVGNVIAYERRKMEP